MVISTIASSQLGGDYAALAVGANGTLCFTKLNAERRLRRVCGFGERLILRLGPAGVADEGSWNWC